MAMCRRLWDENGLFSYNENKVRGCLHKCYNQDGAIVGVIGDHGRIEASTCLMISDFYYTNDWHLAELWNFVEEQHRRSRNAEALIEFGKVCAKKMGIPFFTGIITNRRMAGKVRLYRRLLGYPTGAFFVYNSRWESEPMEDHSALRSRLRETGKLCNNSKFLTVQQQREVGALLVEAARIVGGEDNFWEARMKEKADGRLSA